MQNQIIGLSQLCLSKVNLDLNCANMISNYLIMKPAHLRELDLSWNKFTQKGVSLICQSVQATTQLESFNISYNVIDPNDPLKEFAGWLRTNYNLKHVNLSGVL